MASQRKPWSHIGTSRENSWIFAALGAFIFLATGYAGHLHPIRPLDRLLNPNARGYLESADDYVNDIFRHCSNESDRVLAHPGTSRAQAMGTFRRCYDSSLDGAVERGYLTPEEIAGSNTDP